jgi:hypothetical protein
MKVFNEVQGFFLSLQFFYELHMTDSRMINQGPILTVSLGD